MNALSTICCWNIQFYPNHLGVLRLARFLHLCALFELKVAHHVQSSAGSNGKGDPPVGSSQNGGPAGGPKPDQAPAEVQEPEQVPPVAPDDSAKAKMEASREQSAVNGGASGLQKHWSGESAGGTSYEEGGEEEEGTLDDIDEEDEGEGEAAGGSWQVGTVLLIAFDRFLPFVPHCDVNVTDVAAWLGRKRPC